MLYKLQRQSLLWDFTVMTDDLLADGNQCHCHWQGHAGSKTLQQQNPPVRNWSCWLTRVDLCNGSKNHGWGTYGLLLHTRNQFLSHCAAILRICGHPVLCLHYVAITFPATLCDLRTLHISILMPSVLWRCWLGFRKSIWPVKIEWRGVGVVMSGVRCRLFAYGPGFATAFHNPIISCLI